MATSDPSSSSTSSLVIPAQLTAAEVAQMQAAILAQQAQQTAAANAATAQANAAALALLQPGVGVIGGTDWNTIMGVLTTMRSAVSDPTLDAHLDGVLQCGGRLVTAFNALVAANQPAS